MKMVPRAKRVEKEACARLAATDGCVTTALSAQSAMSAQAMELPVCPAGDLTEIQDNPVAVVRVTLAVLSADAVGLVLMSLGVIVTKTHSRSCRGNTQDCLVSPKLVIWEGISSGEPQAACKTNSRGDLMNVAIAHVTGIQDMLQPQSGKGQVSKPRPERGTWATWASLRPGCYASLPPPPTLPPGVQPRQALLVPPQPPQALTPLP